MEKALLGTVERGNVMCKIIFENGKAILKEDRWIGASERDSNNQLHFARVRLSEYNYNGDNAYDAAYNIAYHLATRETELTYIFQGGL